MENSLRITSALTPGIKSSDPLGHRIVNTTQWSLVDGGSGGDDMYRFRQISRILISTVLLFVVNSCAVLKLPPPDHDLKTILVLPFKVTDKTVITGTRGHGFNYGYEIVGI